MFYNHIHIPVPIIKGELPPTPAPHYFYHYQRVGTDFVTSEFLDWLESKQIFARTWSNLILFYANPHSRTAVHTDKGSPNLWALNMQLTPGDINVNWHDASNGAMQTEDLQYVQHDPDSPVIQTTKLSNTLCRIGIPHSSTNTTDHGAWFLSYRSIPSNLPWSMLCKKFSTSQSS